MTVDGGLRLLSLFNLGWVYDAPRGCPNTKRRQDGAPVTPGSHRLTQRMVGWAGLAGLAEPGLLLWWMQRKHRTWDLEPACLGFDASSPTK